DASKDRVPVCFLVVGLTHKQLKVLLKRGAKCDETALVWRYGLAGQYLLRNVHGGFAVRRRINTIVDERGSQRFRDPRIALRRGECRPIARQHRWSSDESLRVRRILTKDRVLEAAKEKQPIFDDGTTDRAAELVALQAAVDFLSISSNCGEILRGVEQIVTYEFEQVAVKLIRTGFGHDSNSG